MAIVTTNNQNYSDIADAIRNKGVSGVFKPSEMADAIASIPAGGGGLPEGITELYTGTFTLSANVATYTVNHNLGKIPKVFICFIEDQSVLGGTIFFFSQFFIGRDISNPRNGYGPIYTANSSGSTYADAGGAGVVSGTDLNNIAMKNNYIGPTFKAGSVYRWVFLV